MKITILKFRILLANKLVKLAIWIRPKEVTQLMQSIQDGFIFGTGVARINPKEIFKK